MQTLHIAAGMINAATAAASLALVATAADRDRPRSVALIGMMGAIGSTLYILIDRRISRVETATARVIEVEEDVLHAVRDRAYVN